MTRYFNTLSPAMRGAVFMVAAGAIFALSNTLVQYGTMLGGIAPARLVFWQYFIALLLFSPWVIRVGLKQMRTPHWKLHLLRVALSGVGVQLWVIGLAHVPIWQAIALIMLSPFFVTLGAGVFLGEKPSLQRWGAVTLGFVGGMIILAPWAEDFSIYTLYPVGAAVLWAGTSLITKHLTATESPESLTVYLLLLLTPVNAALALKTGIMPTATDALWVLAGVGILTALAQLAIARAYATADASFLQPFDHIKLPFNVVLGVLAFGFVPPGSMWIGSILIIGSSLFLLRLEARQD